MIPDFVRALHNHSQFDYNDYQDDSGELLFAESSTVSNSRLKSPELVDYSDYDGNWTDTFASGNQKAVESLEFSRLPSPDPNNIRSMLINLGRKLSGDFYVESKLWEPTQDFFNDIASIVPWIILTIVIGIIVGLSMWSLSFAFVRLAMYSNHLKSRRNDVEQESSVTSSKSPKKSKRFLAPAYTPVANFKNRKNKKEKFFGIRGKNISHGLGVELKHPDVI